MATDWTAAQRATVPYQRRRDALAQEHARNTAAAAASTPRPPHSPSPFVISTLKTCACGARPRYGFDEHVKHCPAALAAAQPVTAVEVVEAIVSAPFDELTRSDWRETEYQDSIDAAELAARKETTCPKCGKVLKKHGAHFHIRACKG